MTKLSLIDSSSSSVKYSVNTWQPEARQGTMFRLNRSGVLFEPETHVDQLVQERKDRRGIRVPLRHSHKVDAVVQHVEEVNSVLARHDGRRHLAVLLLLHEQRHELFDGGHRNVAAVVPGYNGLALAIEQEDGRGDHFAAGSGLGAARGSTSAARPRCVFLRQK